MAKVPKRKAYKEEGLKIVQLKVPQDMLDQIHNWMDRHPEVLHRTQAMLYLMARALKSDAIWAMKDAAAKASILGERKNAR